MNRNARRRARYATDPAWRDQELTRSNAWKAANPDKVFEQHQRELSRRRMKALGELGIELPSLV